jgi:hypothetical protein
MIRIGSGVLGIGLVILWIVGLSDHATHWLTWLDGLGALCAFAVAAMAPSEGVRRDVSSASIALSIGLYVLWIIALATSAASWLAWWTFAFACAFLLLGVGGMIAPQRDQRLRAA